MSSRTIPREPDRAAIGSGAGTQLGVDAAPSRETVRRTVPRELRPIRRPPGRLAAPFRPQAGRRAARLERGRSDHRRIRDGGLGGRPSHRPGEDPRSWLHADQWLSPLTSTAFTGCRGSSKGHVPLAHRATASIAVDEDHPARHPPVMDARFAFAGSPLGKEGLQPCHLRFFQPEEVAQTQDQWVLTLALDGNQHAPDQAGGVRLGHKTTTVSLHKRHSRRLLRDQLRSIHAAYPRTQSWQVL